MMEKTGLLSAEVDELATERLGLENLANLKQFRELTILCQLLLNDL